MDKLVQSDNYITLEYNPDTKIYSFNGTINHKNINLTCEKNWYYVTGHDFMRMYYTDGNEADAIPEFVYEGDTDDYSYFKMITDYNMGSLFFNVKNKHTYKGIVRIPKMESL